MILFLILLTLITPITSLTKTTKLLWKPKNTSGLITYYRPPWAKNVTIEIDDNTRNVLSVKGIIIPLSTSDRQKAPTSYNICHINNTCVQYDSRHCYNNGHIMGLGNGGPDLSENIVEQWGNWQQSGGVWYDFEEYINKRTLNLYGWNEKKPHPKDLCKNETQNDCTKEPNNKVYWEINLRYGENSCEPERYDGIINFGDKKFQFNFVNNGTEEIVLEPYKEPDNKDKDDNLLPWIFVFIIFTILWGCFFYHRKRLFQNHLNEIEFEQLQDN